MISQPNRFKKLYSFPGYTALIWVAYSWAHQADLTESYPATNFRHCVPPLAQAKNGSCSISEPARRCWQATCPALCWQSSVQVTVSYRKLSNLSRPVTFPRHCCTTCLPVTWAHPSPSSLDRVARYLLRNWPFSALLFLQTKIEPGGWKFLLGWARNSSEAESITLQFRSKHISPDFPAFVYKMGIHSLHGEQKTCKQRWGFQTPCLSKQKIIWSVTTAPCERRMTLHTHMQPLLVVAVEDQRPEDNLLQPHDLNYALLWITVRSWVLHWKHLVLDPPESTSALHKWLGHQS